MKPTPVLRRSSLSLPVCLPTIAALLLVLAFSTPPFEAQTTGVFSDSGALGTADQTANVGLSSTKTYIEAIDLGDTVNTTVNGVLFTGSGGAGNPTGTGWAFTNTPSRTGGGPLPAGVLGGLTNNFIYGGTAANPSTLTLSGLTVGQTYTLTFYNRSWEAAGARVQTFNASGASTATTTFDQDIGATAQGNLNLLRYTFLAGTATQILTIAPTTAASFHLYAFTNEQVFNNSWVSGADWTTATWGIPGQPNGAGSNANFAAQGAPTAINLDAPRTVGHLQFDGANAWTLSGANTLTLQGDVGGVSVLSTLSGSHTISTAVALASDTVKFGTGTLTLGGAVSGTKGLIVNGGTLRFATSNTYAATGATGVNAGAFLDLNGTSQTLAVAAGNGTILNNATGTSVLSLSSGAFAGLIRDNDNAGAGRISVVKTGAGTTTLSGANTFTEELAVTAGVLNVASLSDYGVPSAIGARTVGQEIAGNIGLRLAGGTLQYTGATAQSTNRQIRVNTGTSAIDASGSVPAATLAFTHSGANTDFFQNSGARRLVLTGTNTGANTFAIKLDQTGGQTTLQKTGAGTWFVTNHTNNYTGETIIGGGILNVASLSDYGVPSAIGPRTLPEENGTETGVGLHFQGGTLQYTGATPQSTNRNIRVYINNGATIDASGSVPEATLSFTKTGANMNLFDTGGTRTITLTGTNTGANGFSIQLTNQGGSPTGLTKAGAGTWSLNGPDTNTATGTTSVLGGTLILNKTATTAVSGPLTIGNGSASAIVQLAGTGGNQIIDTSVAAFAGTGANAGRLQLLNNSETIAGLSSASGAGVVENESGSAGTGTLTTNVTSALSYAGLIRDGDGAGTDGVLAFRKTGAAAQTLTGALSYTGATVIDGGRLQLDGTAAGGTLTTSGIAVNPTATLGFTANAASPLTLKAGSTLNFNGGTVNFDLASVAGTDRIAADTLTFTANTNFGYTQVGALDFNQTYTLVTYSTLNNGGGFSIPATNAGRLVLTPAIDSPNSRITMTATLDNAAWSSAAGANWGADLTNWTPYNPNAPGDAALFGAALATSGTVTVDAPKTVGYMSFNNATASYTIGAAGSSNLTLNSGGAFAAQIINDAGSHSIAENVALASDATVISAGGTTVTIRGIVSGAKALTKTGPGTLVLANTNTWSAGTTVVAGTLRLGDGTTDGTIAGGVTNNATLNFNNTGALTFGGLISGTGALTKTSGGTLTLTTANTHTGGTTVSVGTLDLGGGTAAGSVPGVITNDATLRFSRSGTVTIDTVVNGAGTTIISGGGIQNLAATTAINTPNVSVGDALQGYVYFSAPNQLNGTTGAVLNIGAHAANSRINLNGFSQTVAGLTGTGIVQNHESAGGTPAATFTINVPGANSYSWTGLIRNQAGGALGLTKTGLGEQIMNFSIAPPAYSGATTINQGRLVFGSTFGGAPAWNTSLIDVIAGAEVGLTGAGAGVVSWSEGKTISGAGSLVRTGADVNTVSITNTNNSFTGYTKLSGTGTLAVVSLANIGAASSIGAGDATSDATNAASLVFDGGTLRYTGGAVASNRLLTLTTNGGTLDASGSGAVNFNHTGSIATSGSGARMLVLTGTNTGNNTLVPALGDGTGGTTSVTKSSAGTWVLSGANSYTGATTVNGGRLQFDGSAAAGTLTTSDLTISTGGTLGFTTGAASTLTLGSSLTLNGGTASFDAGAGSMRDQIAASALNITANSTVSLTNPYPLGLISLGTPYTVATYASLSNPGGWSVTGAPVGRLNFTPVVGTNAITVTASLDSAAWNNTAAGPWGTGPWTGYTPAIAGDAPLFGSTLAASGAVTLEGAKAAGFMTFDNAAASYTIGTAGSSNLTLSNPGTSAAAIFVKAGSHTIAENVTLASDLFVSTDTNTTLTVNGTINGGTRALGKLGPGTLKLTANNTFTGGTKINEGTLEVGAGGATGTLGSGTVLNNGTLVWNNTAGIIVQGANAITGTGALTIKNGNINVFYHTGGSVSSGTITVDGTGSTVAPSFEIWTPTATVTLANDFILNSMGSAPDRAAINQDGGGGPVVLNGSLTLAGNSRLGTGGFSWNSMTVNGLVTGPGKLFVYERPEATPTSTQLSLTNSLNDYAGGTEIEKGRLRITQVGALGTGVVTVTGAQSQFLVDLDVPGTIANNFILGGGGAPTSTNYAFGNGTMVFQNDAQTTTLSGAVTLSGNAKIRSYSSGETVIFSQPIGGSGDLTFEAGGAAVNHNQTWSIEGSASTFAGNVLIRSDGGGNATLRLDGGALPAASVATLEDRGGRSAVLDLNGQSQTLAGLNRIAAGGLGSFVTNGSFSPATLTIDSAADSAFSGTIGANTAAVTTGQNTGGDDIALVKTGTGTFTLSGAHTYTGATTVGTGKLVLENITAFASPITVNSAAADALTFNQTSGSATFAPAIAGTGAVTKTGTGAVTLTGALSHTGPTTVSNGRLQLDGAAATGTLATSNVTIATDGTLGFTTGAASTLTLGATATLSGGIANLDLGGTGVNDVLASGTLAITSDSTLSLNLYQLGSPAFGSPYTVATYTTLSNPGGFDVTSPAVGRLSFGVFVGANAITVTPSLDTTAWNNTAGGTWATGPWTGYTPLFAGDAPLFGGTLAASNVVTLDDARSAGFITFDNATASYTVGTLGGNNLTLANPGTSSAVLHVKTGSHVIAENIVLASDALVRAETGATLTLGGAASGAGKTLTKTGPGTLVLTGANTFSGITTISAGTLQWGDGITNGSAPGNIVNNGVWIVDSAANQTYGGLVSGTGSLVKDGNAILNLSNANTFTGGVTVNAGTIEIGNNGALGSTTAVLTINGGGLRAANAPRVIANPTTVNGDFVLGRLTDFSNTVTLGADATITANNYDGPANGNSRFMAPIEGPFRATFAQGLQGIGSGALVVEAVNTNSGGTTVASGRVTVTAFGALAEADLTVDGGILNLNNFAQTVTSLSGFGGTINLSTGHFLTVDQNDDTAYSGTITGGSGGALIKSGTGVLDLGGTHTYTGATYVDEGTLVLADGASIAGSDVTVAGDATLDVAGEDTVGTVSTGALLFDNNSITAVDLLLTGSPAQRLDRINLSGDLDITAGATLALSVTGSDSLASGTKLALMQYTGSLWNSGVFTGYGQNSILTIGGNDWWMRYDDDEDGTGLTGGKFVTITVATPYEAWLDGHGLLGEANTGPLDDLDSDGLTNEEEFGFDTDPNNGTSGPGPIEYVADPGGSIITTGDIRLVRVGGIYKVVFGRRKDHVAAGLTYTVQLSANLVNWVDSADLPANVTVPTGGYIDAVSVDFPNNITWPGGPGPVKPRFARVVVDLQP